MAASPRSRTQVAAVLAFVISHMTFLAAQDDETGRCPKVACDGGLSRIVISSVSENSFLLSPSLGRARGWSKAK